MILRTCLALVAALTLGGCWSGSAWYGAADAVAALPDGSYAMVEPGSPTPEGDRITVRNQPDHTMLLTGAERPWQAIAVRVDTARGDRFLLQLRQADEDNAFIRSKALYVLLDVQPDGLFLTILPCGGSIAEAVERAGGSISRDPQSAASCTFPDKTTLITQLQTLLQKPPRHDVQLLPDAP